MLESLTHILDKISFFHLNMLFLLGLALFGGVIGGRLFEKLHIPQVVGYISIGILIGQSGFNIIDADTVKILEPFNYFALGLIGFIIGGELKKEVFLKYGKPLMYILLCEGIAPFLLVTLFVGIVGSFLFGAGPFPWALGLLLGAIASATDPATTSSVLRENKTRGPLTSTILGIVALDDGLALLLFAVACSIAGILIGHGAGVGISKIILHSFYEIVGAAALGLLSGLLLSRMLKEQVEKERILAFSLGMVLLVIGLSLATGLSMLLAVMTLGIVVVNSAPKKTKEAFTMVGGFASPIYVLFFVLIGAKLQLGNMSLSILFLVVVYLLCGLTGKMIGSYVGARLSKAPATVLKYLPLSLFSQAGVAIGLSILVAQYFPGNIANILVIVITTSTFVTQLLGPPFTEFALKRAGEVGLNITEDDIIQKTKVKEAMDKNPPLIYENMRLEDILKIFSESDNLYYPVVDKNKKLCGIITIEGIKNTFLERDIGELVLAYDLMEPVATTALAQTFLSEVKETLNRDNIEYLPIVNKDNKIEGFIESKSLNKWISTKIIKLQKQLDSLDKT